MKSRCSNCDEQLLVTEDVLMEDSPRMCNSCQVLIMAREMSPTESIIEEAIRSARIVQEFLWSNESLHSENRNWQADKDIWLSTIQKRINKLEAVDFDNHHFKIELRKRLLQLAAVAIAALESITDEENNYIKEAIAGPIINTDLHDEAKSYYPGNIQMDNVLVQPLHQIKDEKLMTAYITDENNFPAAIEYALADKKATYYRLCDGALLLYDQKVDKGYKLPDAAKTSTGLMFFVLDWFKAEAPKFGPAKEGSVGGTIKCMRLSKFLSADPALISVESIWMPSDAEYWPDDIKTMISFDK